MIVLNKEPTVEHKVEQHEKETFESMFRKELDAYCIYKDWAEETTDPILEMALEEIMLDEYLHAKFLRDYMIDNDMYSLHDNDPHEKKFWKIQKHMFHE
jgi:rubrerythrin